MNSPSPRPTQTPTTTASTKGSRERELAESVADFTRFCGLLQVRLKSEDERAPQAGKRVPMRLTALQRRYNRERTSRDIILKPRQVFMTTLEAARDLWWFLTKPGARVVIICQSQGEQGALADISEKFRIFFDCLGRLGLRLDLGKDAGASWTLPRRDATMRIIQSGGSELSAGRKGSGGTVNRLHMTEMAKWGDYAANTFLSITESVPREGSEIVNESTPLGASGFFYDQWMAASESPSKSAYSPHFFPWWQHPEYRIALAPGESSIPAKDLESALAAKGVTPEQLKWRRWKVKDKAGDEQAVTQEYPSDPDTCFLQSGRCFFDLMAIAENFVRCRAPLALSKDRDENGKFTVWAEPKPGSQYGIGADASEGAGGDPAAAVIFERGTGEHVASLHGQLAPEDLAVALIRLSNRYNDALIGVERDAHGFTVLREIRRLGEEKRLYKHSDGKFGWPENVATRPVILDGFSAGHRGGTMKTHDRGLLGEMKSFVVGPTGKAEAEYGKKDDRVMAGAIAWHLVTGVKWQAPVTGGFYKPGPAPEDRDAGFG